MSTPDGLDGSPFNSKLALQACVALGAAWAVGAGAWGVIDGLGSRTAGLVSQGRYLSGLLMAIGLGYWTTIFNIEQKTARFRLLTALVAIGGLCRLLGLAMGDDVSLATLGPLVLELGLAPLLCLWQQGGPLPLSPTLGNRRDQNSGASPPSISARPTRAWREPAPGEHERQRGRSGPPKAGDLK